MRRVSVGLLMAALLLGGTACGGDDGTTIILAIETTDRIDMGMAPEDDIAIQISPAPGDGAEVTVDVTYETRYEQFLTVKPTELVYGSGETKKTIEIRPKAPTNGQFIPIKFKVRQDDKDGYDRTLQVRITQH